jgi:predicted phage terminase large subunit-like protein
MAIQSAKFQSGLVLFPRQASWLTDLEAELFAFPRERHNDQVDSISQALSEEQSNYLWDAISLANLEKFTLGLFMR